MQSSSFMPHIQTIFVAAHFFDNCVKHVHVCRKNHGDYLLHFSFCGSYENLVHLLMIKTFLLPKRLFDFVYMFAYLGQGEEEGEGQSGWDRTRFLLDVFGQTHRELSS